MDQSDSKGGRVWGFWRKLSSILGEGRPQHVPSDLATQISESRTSPAAADRFVPAPVLPAPDTSAPEEEPLAPVRVTRRPKPTAYDAVMKRALAGDAAAEYLLAIWHFQNQISNASREAGLDWLLKAIEHGHSDALKLFATFDPCLSACRRHLPAVVGEFLCQELAAPDFVAVWVKRIGKVRSSEAAEISFLDLVRLCQTSR